MRGDGASPRAGGLGPGRRHLHGWMARENATIMAVLCPIIGAKLIGDAITALPS